MSTRRLDLLAPASSEAPHLEPAWSAAQRVLNLLDIFHQIVEHCIYTKSGFHIDTNTLLALALTRRAFFRSAVAPIWRHLPCVGLMLALLPAHMLPKDAGVTSTWPDQPRHAGVTDEHLARWNMYAPFVETLTVDFPDAHIWRLLNESDKRASSRRNIAHVIHQVTAHLPGHHPLPNLRRLAFYTTSASPSQIEVLQCLIPLQLIEFTVGSLFATRDGRIDGLAGLLQRLGRCPSLVTLSLGSYAIPPTLVNQLQDTLSRTTSLQHLAVRGLGLTHAIIASLRHLPHLVHLELADYYTDEEEYTIDDGEVPIRLNEVDHALYAIALIQPSQIPKLVNADHLQQLEHLHLTANLSLIRPFLDNARPRMKSIVIHTEAIRPTQLSELAHILRLCYVQHKRLSEIHLNISGQIGEDWWNHLGHLKVIDLTEFIFENRSHGPAQVSNQILASIAKSWPRLEGLQLKGFPADSPITLDGLLPLVTGCPNLITLSIPSLNTYSPSAGPVRTTANPSLPMISLYIHRRKVQADILAAFLGALWPNARVEPALDHQDVNSILDVSLFLRGITRGVTDLRGYHLDLARLH